MNHSVNIELILAKTSVNSWKCKIIWRKSTKCQCGKHKAIFIHCPELQKYTRSQKALVTQILPDVLLLVNSIYWIEFDFNLRPNLTLAPLMKRQGAFVAPHFVLSQLFMSTPNTDGITPPAAERSAHFRHSHCSQAKSVWGFQFDATIVFGGQLGSLLTDAQSPSSVK